MKTLIFPVLALIAFAGNSVLCRLALAEGAIDPASFTMIRLISGALILAIIILFNRPPAADGQKGSWAGAAMLFVYALGFSYAYVSLDTGVGALILFGAVQLTMILIGLATGNKIRYPEWAGLVMAFAGFVYLIQPRLAVPESGAGVALMTLAGIAWGLYSLKGRGSRGAINDTAYNFFRTIPFVLVLALLTLDGAYWSQTGLLLAVASGAVTSGIGYALWYIALRNLSVTVAAVGQLSVPLIAAAGGVIFAGELISIRMSLAAVLVLGGIFIVVMSRYRHARMVAREGS
ncbi:DMT family transporter [Pseudidiomarina sp.]|uniref:DMT family transporter n=1 Tax=Pseudidiomarina sp. TaxID=2081707 RepID=UPI00299D4475|nr:DMT family transporter [Pseudidiomarina sp.]MDX1705664.1 DMT family transporter [Pseudidiomarina sp.]